MSGLGIGADFLEFWCTELGAELSTPQHDYETSWLSVYCFCSVYNKYLKLHNAHSAYNAMFFVHNKFTFVWSRIFYTVHVNLITFCLPNQFLAKVRPSKGIESYHYSTS